MSLTTPVKEETTRLIKDRRNHLGQVEEMEGRGKTKGRMEEEEEEEGASRRRAGVVLVEGSSGKGPVEVAANARRSLAQVR